MNIQKILYYISLILASSSVVIIGVSSVGFLFGKFLQTLTEQNQLRQIFFAYQESIYLIACLILLPTFFLFFSLTTYSKEYPFHYLWFIFFLGITIFPAIIILYEISAGATGHCGRGCGIGSIVYSPILIICLILMRALYSGSNKFS